MLGNLGVMKTRLFLLLLVVAFAFVAGDAHAKKKKPGAEGVDVMCAEKGKKLTFTGKLFSIQPAAREVTVRTSNGSKEFRIAGNCKLATTQKAEASLTDLRLGEEVRVTYFTTKLDTDVACSIVPASAPVKKSAK